MSARDFLRAWGGRGSLLFGHRVFGRSQSSNEVYTGSGASPDASRREFLLQARANCFERDRIPCFDPVDEHETAMYRRLVSLLMAAGVERRYRIVF
jgi:hypothetical protein